MAEVNKHVLKIIKEEKRARVIRLSLHGHFTGQYIPEVEKALSESSCKAREVALDLTNVTFVDRKAMEFLSRATSKITKIENTPSYVMRWIEQELS